MGIEEQVSKEVIKWWIVQYCIAAQDRTRKDPDYYANKACELEKRLKDMEKENS